MCGDAHRAGGVCHQDTSPGAFRPKYVYNILLHGYVCSVQLQQTSLDYTYVSDEVMLEQQMDWCGPEPCTGAVGLGALVHRGVSCCSSIQQHGQYALQEANVGHRTS